METVAQYVPVPSHARSAVARQIKDALLMSIAATLRASEGGALTPGKVGRYRRDATAFGVVGLSWPSAPLKERACLHPNVSSGLAVLSAHMSEP